MDSTKKAVITLMTFLAVFELTECKGLCEFAEMFPGKASEDCFQRKGTKEDKVDKFTPPCAGDMFDLNCSCNNSTRADEPRSCQCRGYNATVERCIPNDCYQLKLGGIEENGIYAIKTLSERSINVSCDMETDEGGWTIIQRRTDGSVEFNKSWNDYKEGFGTSREFWLGNENLHHLTQQTTYTLYIALSSSTDRHAKYNNFTVGGESENYKLVSLGEFSGSPGVTDAMRCHESTAFTTYDQDNDRRNDGNCGVIARSGWWFNGGSTEETCENYYCKDVNLNGAYGDSALGIGIVWNSRKILTFTKMQIRP